MSKRAPSRSLLSVLQIEEDAPITRAMRLATNNSHLRRWLGLREDEQSDHVPVAMGFWMRNRAVYNCVVWSVPARKRAKWYGGPVFDWRNRIKCRDYHRHMWDSEPDVPPPEL